MLKHRNIGILLFDDVEELDFGGPWEVFAYLRAQRPEHCGVYTVSERGGEVRCAKGLRVIADHSFESAPKADVLVVPGGHGRRREVNNPRTIDFIRAGAARAEVTASVCTGAFLLEKAGLLNGRKATTYWAATRRPHNSNDRLTPPLRGVSSSGRRALGGLRSQGGVKLPTGGNALPGGTSPRAPGGLGCQGRADPVRSRGRRS